MLSGTGTAKVWLACGITDMRKGIDGLAVLVQQLLVAAAVYFAFWLISASLGMIDERGSRRTILKILSVMLTFVALLFLYRTVPNRRVSWSDAMAGALIGGAGFEAMKALFTAVVATFGAAGYPVPETPLAPRNR